MNLEKIKATLKAAGMFTSEELRTLCPLELKFDCDYCKKKCTRLNILEECAKKCKICFDCLEQMYENETDSSIMFVCTCCNEKIQNFTAIT